MPARSALFYVQHKYVHETLRDRYIADMLWAPASGMVFKESKRYHELIAPPKFKRQEEKSGSEIISETIAKFKGH